MIIDKNDKEVSEEDYLKIKEILEKSKADIIDNIIKNTLKRWNWTDELEGYFNFRPKINSILS